MVKNKQCLACGEKFSYCPSCSRVDKLAPAWKSQFCSEPCMTLWTTLTKFGMNYLSKHEAKEIISALDLKPIDAYVECVKRDYAKVMAEEKKPKRGKRAEMQIIIDEAMNLPKEVVVELVENKIEQPIEAAEQVAEESTVHEVVIKENE